MILNDPILDLSTDPAERRQPIELTTHDALDLSTMAQVAGMVFRSNDQEENAVVCDQYKELFYRVANVLGRPDLGGIMEFKATHDATDEYRGFDD